MCTPVIDTVEMVQIAFYRYIFIQKTNNHNRFGVKYAKDFSNSTLNI